MPAGSRRRIMSGPRPTSQAERDESPSERADRNYSELVQELRVSQTGVQILFAFLLTLAFSGSFPHASTVFSYVLTSALLAAACSSLCFMAPVVIHRTSFRLGGKDRLVWFTHRFAMAGLALLVLAMLLSIWIVIAYLFNDLAAHVITGTLACVVGILWIAVPLRFRAEVTSPDGD